MADVTVVMAVYNGGPYVRLALESVVTQSILDLDVVVVDDGSTDETEAILAEYSRRDARITVIRQKNAGVVAALNRAWPLVKSPYIARLDADDVSVHDRLERQLDFLAQNPSVALVGGAAIVINSQGEPLYQVDLPTSDAEIKMVLPKQNVFVSSAVVMRREALLAVGGYRPAFRWAEDYDLWLRIAEGYEVANLPEVVVHYRVHLTQATTTELERQVLAAMGSRLSLKFRHANENDPFVSPGSVTKEALCRLGVAENEIDGEIAKAAADWASVMQRAGYHQAAAGFAGEAWRRGGRDVLTRAALGGFYLASAREYALGGHSLRGFIDAARAVRWQPALLWRIFFSAVRRLARW